MVMISNITIYTLPNCTNCDRLKKELARKGLAFEERNMSSADSLTELRFNGIFTLSAPVLQIGEDFFTSKDLFDAGNVNREIAKKLEGSDQDGIHDKSAS